MIRRYRRELSVAAAYAALLLVLAVARGSGQVSSTPTSSARSW